MFLKIKKGLFGPRSLTLSKSTLDRGKYVAEIIVEDDGRDAGFPLTKKNLTRLEKEIKSIKKKIGN